MAEDESPVPSLTEIHEKWHSTKGVADFQVHLAKLYPGSTPLELAHYSVNFSSAHMMAFLVGMVGTSQEDPDKPSWL